MRDKTYCLMHFNPGAAGNKGFHSLCTAIRFEIVGDKMQNLEVWELPKLKVVDTTLGI